MDRHLVDLEERVQDLEKNIKQA